MARKPKIPEHLYHLFVFSYFDYDYEETFQLRADCYFKNVDSLVKYLSSILCRVKGKRELIKNMEDDQELVMTEPLFQGKITYVVRKVKKTTIMFNLLYMFDKEAAYAHWRLDSLTDEFFKRVGESKDGKKKAKVKLPKI